MHKLPRGNLEIFLFQIIGKIIANSYFMFRRPNQNAKGAKMRFEKTCSFCLHSLFVQKKGEFMRIKVNRNLIF